MRGTADEPGIIPMAVQEVFGLIESLQDREFLLRVSYMEVSSFV
jgi:centromeric protein E